MAKGSAASESTEISKPYTLFVNTNLGTHIAMIVSEHDSLRDVKQKIVSVHADCYPEIGEIDIQAMKVKRKAYLYRLSDSMPVKSAFLGVKRDWFLYVDATSGHLVSKEHYFCLEPGSSSLRNCLSIMDEPSAQTEQINVQLDQQSKRVSILDGMGGEVSEGLNLGNKSINFEQNKASLGTNKRTVSGKLKSRDPVSNENEVAETYTEQKKDESGKIRETQSDDMLGEAAQLEPPKKKRRKEEKIGDYVADCIKDPSKGSDTGICVSKNETFEPDSSVPKNSSGETLQAEPIAKEKLTNEMRDGDSFCEPSEKEPCKPNKMSQEDSLEDQQEVSIRQVESLDNVKRTKKKKSSRVREGVDSVVSLSNDNVRQENPKEAVEKNDKALGKESEAETSPEETLKSSDLTNISAILENETNCGPVEGTGEAITASGSLLGTAHGVVVEPSASGNVDVDPLLSMEKGENADSKMGNEIDARDQAVASGVSTAKKVKKHKVGRAGNDFPVGPEPEKGFDGDTSPETKKEGNILCETGKPRTSIRPHIDAESLEIADSRAHKGKRKSTKMKSSTSRSYPDPPKEQKVLSADLTPSNDENKNENEDSSLQLTQMPPFQEIADSREHKAKKKSTKMKSSTSRSYPDPPKEHEVLSGDLTPSNDENKNENEDSSLQLTQIPPFQEIADSREHKAKRKSTKMKSSTSRSYPDPPKEQKVLSGDLTPSNDENKNEEIALSKKVKKSRLRKPTLEEKSDSLLEDGKDSAFVTDPSQYQVSRNNGFFQLSSDTLEHNVVERPLEENFIGDDHPKVGCMDEDNGHMEASKVDGDEIDFSQYFLPKPDNHEVVSPAKEPLPQDSGVRASDMKLKTNKKMKKLDKHSEIISSKENRRHKKKRDGGVSDTVPVPLLKDDLKPSPPPTIESVPDKVSRSKIVNASGTVTLVHAHRPHTSSNKESSVDKIYKNEKKGLGDLQSRADQYHNTVKPSSSNQMGEVLNFPKHEKSIQPTSNTTFENSGSESAQDKDEVSNSTSSTRTPSASSSEDDDSDLDSHGSYGRKQKDNDVAMSQSKNMTLDMILRSSKSYKKAKQRATESQLEDTESQPEMVGDSLD